MKKTLSIMTLGLLTLPGQGWAVDNATLEKQIQQLVEQNRLLQERVLNLESQVGCQVPLYAQPQAQQVEKGLAKPPSGPAVDSITERLRQVERILQTESVSKPQPETEEVEDCLLPGAKDYARLSGLVEVEIGSTEDYQHAESSDISLVTVEFGLEVDVTSWSHVQMVLLYEEGAVNEHIKVNEGIITLGNREKFPAALIVGKKYLPFGSYLTSMVSDPLAMQLAETVDSVAQIGFQADGLYGSAYIFNGDINEAGEDDKIDNYGLNVGYAHKIGNLSFDLGVDWLNNIGDTDGLGDYLSDVVADDEIAEYVPGFASHILMAYGPMSFFAEYVGALASFDKNEISFGLDVEAARPQAWGVEVGYSTEVMGKETLFSVGYQGTDEALVLDLPEARYLASVRMTLMEKTSLALEYRHDEDYGINEGGTGDNGKAATMQLAVEF